MKSLIILVSNAIDPRQFLLLIIGLFLVLLISVIFFTGLVRLFNFRKAEISSLKSKLKEDSTMTNSAPNNTEKVDSNSQGTVNNIYINDINLNKDEKNSSPKKEEPIDFTSQEEIKNIEPADSEFEVEEVLSLEDDDFFIDEEDEYELEQDEKDNTSSKKELKEIEDSIIDYQKEDSKANAIEESKITTPRRMTLALRLNSSSERLKERYSKLRNYLESYRIHERFLKHRDIYYILKEVIIKGENGNYINKTINFKVAMLTIRRKQLILSLNLDNDSSLTELVQDHNIVIDEKRYNGYDFNLKVSTEKDYNLALKIINKLIEKYKISSKKTHKEVDYVSMFSNELSTFEKRGFGYLIRPMIKLDESEKYSDSLAVKAIILNKIDEPAPSKNVPFEISLNKINDLFESGTTINLDMLKQKGLAKSDSNKLIITDGDYLNKKFFIDADGFSTNVIKMVFLTGGEARINQRTK